MSTGTTEAQNIESDDNLSRCVRQECNAVLLMKRDFNNSVRYAAVRGLEQNIIVGRVEQSYLRRHVCFSLPWTWL